MKLVKRSFGFGVAALAMFLVLALAGCQSQPAASGDEGNAGGNAPGGGGDGRVVVTGDPALLNLNFEDPSQPIPFTFEEGTNMAASRMSYQNGKLHLTNLLSQPTWFRLNSFLDEKLEDFFWQFEFTPLDSVWSNTSFYFRVGDDGVNVAYKIAFIGQNGLEFRDPNVNFAGNNDNAQVVKCEWGGTLIASSRLAWLGPGRPAMVRIVGKGDNCRIWVWRSGREMPAKPTFEFTMDRFDKGDFAIDCWSSDFLLDDMVLFDRAVP